MKHFFAFLLAFSSAVIVAAQSFSFDLSGQPPSEWSATNGSLSVSGLHYKDGSQSLCWQTAGQSNLTVSFTSFTTGSSNSAYLQIYSPSANNDTLTVQFMNNSSVLFTANYLCNYQGWRAFNRAYTEYAVRQSVPVNKVRFTLKPTGTASRTLYFDAVDFNHTSDANRVTGSQWTLENYDSYFTSDNTAIDLFARYSNPDIAVTTPTADELSALASLRTAHPVAPVAGSASALTAAKADAAAFYIVRNADGSVTGNIINTSPAALTTDYMTTLTADLEILAANASKSQSDLTVFQNYLDHFLDQGIGEGCNLVLASNNYTPLRTILGHLCNTLPVCTSAQKDQLLKLIRWLCYYGSLYYSADEYKASLVSDVVYLCLPYMFDYAIYQQDDATAVRELYALKRYLERNTEYTPGGNDILKPDGTGFHHNFHYPNYMYAYKTWEQYIYYLKGTPFRISADAYTRFKKAVISEYIMATPDNGDNHWYANSLCGRKTLAGGNLLQFSKSSFDQLIAVGADCLGSTDNELCAAYNYFFQTTKYSVPDKKYEGFYQFNYSPIGVYRKNNWVVTMRAPTTKFNGAEIYDNTNRFGRYQSDGSVEVMYAGTSVAASGYPDNNTGGGWDWNTVPGATVVRYVSWQQMMPYQSVTGRFDQTAKTKNFAGAMSWGDCGIFAADFDQTDTWSGSAFTATNLTFKKSMFAFDGMVICLGTGIGSSGSYSTSMLTATNLFQSVGGSSGGSFILNGSTLSNPYSTTLATTLDNWMVTPQGTGYFIPKGNDQIVIAYDNQSTPDATGADYASPATTVVAAKAFLNHGSKPSGKSYSFVVVPGTSSTQMQTLTTQMANGGGTVYALKSQTDQLHAITYLPRNITAYSFFSAVSGLTFGIVKSTTSQHLLMDSLDVASNRHYFAICNPNLNPQTDATYGWIVANTQTTLTLNGEWLPVAPVNGVAFSAPSNGTTQVTVTMSGGETTRFAVKNVSEATDVPNTQTDGWVNFTKQQKQVCIGFSGNNDDTAFIRIYNASGKQIYSKRARTSDRLNISTEHWQSGFFVCHISDTYRSKSFKWIQ
jgi:hypothetical protein